MNILIKLLSIILLFSNLYLAISNAQSNEKGMALIPSGIYTPLYTDSSNNQSIKVDSYLIDKYPVTNKKFLEFVIKNPKWQRSRVSSLFSDNNYLIKWESDTVLGIKAAPNSPVTNISWFAAKAFAEYHGKRLPTVAEWELAGMADEYSNNGYDNSEYISRILSWYSKPSATALPEVGTVFKNYYGVYDMHGLVWEWVSDFFNALVTGESRANNGINRNLFCGSGSVGATDFKNYPAFMRFAFRSSLKGNYTTDNLGFRCAKDINN